MQAPMARWLKPPWLPAREASSPPGSPRVFPRRGGREALERAAAAGVSVVQCSRALSGRVGRRRYLQEAGFIPGEDFSPQKARVLLMLALTRTSDRQEISTFFAAH
jgi:L-asparaginase/Glu-tRNA(Gln) amidotransferase subunit D